MVQEIDDLRFQLSPHAKFDFRAAVLLVHDNQVLVTVQPTSGVAIVPGGAVKFGETSGVAAKRELYEELRLQVDEPPLVGVLESFWQQPDRTYQQLVMVHRLVLSQGQIDELVWQEGLQGQWLPKSEVAKHLQPRALAQFLEPSATLLHLVDRHSE